LVSDFYREMTTGEIDVVYGVQRKRKGGLIERAAGALFYALFELLADYKIPRNVVTARLMTRPYVNALVQHQEREIFMAGLWSFTGFRQIGVPVEKINRIGTTYTVGGSVH
jgi:putative glycosyltransferase